MAITEERFNRLESRVNDVGDRLTRIEVGTPSEKRHDWKVWLPMGAPVVALLAIMVTLYLHLDGKLDAIQKDLNDSKGKLAKVESAVTILGDSQKNSLKQIIHDLLASAKDANPQVAARVVGAAAGLMNTLKNERQSADPEFFAETFDAIRSLERSHPEVQLKTASFKAQLQLAEYRSALESYPALPEHETHPINSPLNVQEITEQMGRNGSTLVLDENLSVGLLVEASNTFLKGVNFEVPKETTIPILVEEAAVGTSVQDGFIRGGTQTLDRIAWTNYIFIGTHIRYNGGPLRLTNVTFVNCTFDVPPTDQGIRLAEYAALRSNQLTIG